MMIDLERIRSRCDELLKIAIEEGDTERIEGLQFYKNKLAEDDCFSRQKRSRNLILLDLRLDFSNDEVREFREYLENSTKVKGILYTIDSNGLEHPVEVILDPEVEGYYQFKHGPVCKRRYEGGMYDPYILCEGRWVYDGSLERMFEDPGYEYTYLRCEIPDAAEE